MSSPSSLGRGHADADEPALAVAVVVDALRLVLQGVVDLDDLAGERREHVAHGLDRLQFAVRLARGHLVAHSGQLGVDDLTQRVLREPRDAEDRVFSVDADPVVLLVVPQFLRIRLVGHRASLSAPGALTCRLSNLPAPRARETRAAGEPPLPRRQQKRQGGVSTLSDGRRHGGGATSVIRGPVRPRSVGLRVSAPLARLAPSASALERRTLTRLSLGLLRTGSARSL